MKRIIGKISLLAITLGVGALLITSEMNRGGGNIEFQSVENYSIEDSDAYVFVDPPADTLKRSIDSFQFQTNYTEDGTEILMNVIPYSIEGDSAYNGAYLWLTYSSLGLGNYYRLHFNDINDDGAYGDVDEADSGGAGDGSITSVVLELDTDGDGISDSELYSTEMRENQVVFSSAESFTDINADETERNDIDKLVKDSNLGSEDTKIVGFGIDTNLREDTVNIGHAIVDETNDGDGKYETIEEIGVTDSSEGLLTQDEVMPPEYTTIENQTPELYEKKIDNFSSEYNVVDDSLSTISFDTTFKNSELYSFSRTGNLSRYFVGSDIENIDGEIVNNVYYLGKDSKENEIIHFEIGNVPSMTVVESLQLDFLGKDLDGTEGIEINEISAGEEGIYNYIDNSFYIRAQRPHSFIFGFKVAEGYDLVYKDWSLSFEVENKKGETYLKKVSLDSNEIIRLHSPKNTETLTTGDSYEFKITGLDSRSEFSEFKLINENSYVSLDGSRATTPFNYNLMIELLLILSIVLLIPWIIIALFIRRKRRRKIVFYASPEGYHKDYIDFIIKNVNKKKKLKREELDNLVLMALDKELNINFYKKDTDKKNIIRGRLYLEDLEDKETAAKVIRAFQHKGVGIKTKDTEEVIPMVYLEDKKLKKLIKKAKKENKKLESESSKEVLVETIEDYED